MKILIADDEPHFRNLLKDIVVRWGYEAVLATDGNQAWDVLRAADPPRIAVLDWSMPGMDGVEICREVRELPPEPYLYLILLTSHQSEEDVVNGMEAGADDYITKPFKVNELKVRLNAGKRIVQLQGELKTAVSTVKKLEGVIPICSSCKKIRDDKESWQQLEKYISEHSDAIFSHGTCPDCYEKQMSEVKKLKRTEPDEG